MNRLLTASLVAAFLALSGCSMHHRHHGKCGSEHCCCKKECCGRGDKAGLEKGHTCGEDCSSKCEHKA